MSADTFRQLFALINNLDEREHLLTSIAYYSAATLGGIKPATLLNFTKDTRNHYKLWLRYRDEIEDDLGMSWYELRQTDENIYVLLYKPKALTSCLMNQTNTCFLAERGYNCHMGLSGCLEYLRSRYGMGCPHEIGILLGIPIVDIRSYIQNNGEKCLLYSYWKVYHNVNEAKCIFRDYDSAKEQMAHYILNHYNRMYEKHSSIT